MSAGGGGGACESAAQGGAAVHGMLGRTWVGSGELRDVKEHADDANVTLQKLPCN